MALFDTPGRLTLGDTYENAVAHDRDWLPLDRDALLSSLPAAPVASRLAWSFSRVMLAPSSVMGYSGINARQMSSSPSGTIETSTCVGMNLAAASGQSPLQRYARVHVKSPGGAEYPQCLADGVRLLDMAVGFVLLHNPPVRQSKKGTMAMAAIYCRRATAQSAPR